MLGGEKKKNKRKTNLPWGKETIWTEAESEDNVKLTQEDVKVTQISSQTQSGSKLIGFIQTVKHSVDRSSTKRIVQKYRQAERIRNG